MALESAKSSLAFSKILLTVLSGTVVFFAILVTHLTTSPSMLFWELSLSQMV